MKKIIAEHIEIHKRLIEAFEKNGVKTIEAAAKLLINTIEKKGHIYICGNGGSAADAQHITGELVGRFRRERKGLPAVALTTDTSVITSVGNDYGFEDIFERQVEALVNKNDVLWAFSTSGSSPNIIVAAKLAKKKKAKILAFTGKPNSALEKLSDVCLCVDSPYTSSSQEIHQLAYHIICDLVELQFCEK